MELEMNRKLEQRIENYGIWIRNFGMNKETFGIRISCHGITETFRARNRKLWGWN